MGDTIVVDYQVSRCAPCDLSKDDLAACVAIIKTGDAVDPESAERELPLAQAVAVVRKDGQVVGVGAIKRIRRGYASIVAERSGSDFSSQTPELGYVSVAADHQGHRLSARISSVLLSGIDQQGPVFATTSNPRMKATLAKVGFVQEGQEWDGDSGRLSLWLKRA